MTSSYWQDKVALVTGGSAGFGLHLTRTLAEAGARVVAVARNAERLQAAIAALGPLSQRVTALAADITRDEDVRRAAAQLESAAGRLDALFCNAGRSDRGLLLQTPLERLRELWELNYLAAIRCAQHTVPLLQRSQGHLVLIGSLAAKSAARYLGGYPSSKFPLAAAAQQLRLEIGPEGVHVLLVCPGPIARHDRTSRYDQLAEGLPPSARQPGGGVQLEGLDPEWLAKRVLQACVRREAELIVPAKARLLFALAQLWPTWADRIILRKTGMK